MRLTTLMGFALGAAAAYCLTNRNEPGDGCSEPAAADPRDFGSKATTTGSKVPAGGDPDLVGT